VAIVWLWNRYGSALLLAQQEAQNKQFDDAQREQVEAIQSVAAAQAALEQARADAKRMVEFGSAQSVKLVADERAAAQEHAARIAAHASGELERERYRVRRELLEETVERAHAQAQQIVRDELDAARQKTLVERLITHLERSNA